MESNGVLGIKLIYKHMKIKVNYNLETGFVNGYYPDNIIYTNIPEPFIEITEIEWKNSYSKTMIVKDNIYQEFQKPIEPLEDILLRLRENKISEIKSIASQLILEQYPIYKQLNITRDQIKSSVIFKDMQNFINTIRVKSNKIETKIGNLSLNEIKSINIVEEFNQFIDIIEDIENL